MATDQIEARHINSEACAGDATAYEDGTNSPGAAALHREFSAFAVPTECGLKSAQAAVDDDQQLSRYQYQPGPWPKITIIRLLSLRRPKREQQAGPQEWNVDGYGRKPFELIGASSKTRASIVYSSTRLHLK